MALDAFKSLSIRELLMVVTLYKTGIKSLEKLYDSIFLEDDDINEILRKLQEKGYVSINKSRVDLTDKGFSTAKMGEDLVDKIVMSAVDYGKHVEEVFGFTPVLPFILKNYMIDVGVAFHVFMEWLEKFYGSEVNDEELDTILAEMESYTQ